MQAIVSRRLIVVDGKKQRKGFANIKHSRVLPTQRVPTPLRMGVYGNAGSFVEVVTQFANSPGVYYTSQFIVLFTMFYCSMNWLSYRNTRLEIEKQQQKRDEHKKKLRGEDTKTK